MKLSKVWPGREGMGTDFANFSFLAQITLGLNQASLTMSALSNLFLNKLLRPTSASGLNCSLIFCIDHGSFRNLSVGFSPTQTSHRSKLRR